ncbi:MAG: NAD(P)/FAD-dependent oxidoreductase [Deltaproteobacteria bacterium]|nr:NAD(P)/FAD-dependent oxidoreductase [Deltaproteobacteria bacterium]
MIWDLIIIGAGAAGLFCAAQAGAKGLKVLLLEKAKGPGKKILISGGGRCNFTNLQVSAQNYVSANPHFCKSALAGYQPQDFIRLVERYGIAYYEKERGQLFCKSSSKQILNLLLSECKKNSVSLVCNCFIQSISQEKNIFKLKLNHEVYEARSLVIATGGLSFAKLGASDFAYGIAKQFGHKLIETRPGLTPFLWSKEDKNIWQDLAGLSTPVEIKIGQQKENGPLLFTHQGFSGPVALRASLHYQQGGALNINFFPHVDLLSEFEKLKSNLKQKNLKNILKIWVPERLAGKLSDALGWENNFSQIPLKKLQQGVESLQSFEVKPAGLAGFDKAEVTLGGVDTKEISSKTMESKLCPGLYFIGEALDVTGDLGGYNFQWAWASAYAAAQSMKV